MDRFESMTIFVAVVEAGGFSAAARRLGVPLATVSRKVSELEELLRAQLLTRSTRKIALTEIGQQHYETCRRLLEELDEAERLASGEYRAPRGQLIVAAPVGLGRFYLTPIVAEFLRSYPDVDIELRLADRVVNLVEEGVDLALRVGELPDSRLIAVRLGTISHVVCASPTYLAEHGTPARPDDLSAHNCVTFTSLEAQQTWTFRQGREVIRVPVHSRLSVGVADAAADAASAGLGITRLLCYQASPSIRAGRLQLVLREFEPEPMPVNFVYQTRRNMPQKLKAFIDFVTPRIKPKLVFDP
ncbi:MAG: LysR family transcriptional regulator [Alphaproteobacteria bacterium BRH_c36]|nr:MAG: LysR family transcriptional regulator [Alphaproteobacteria bacterium BRH_c36]